MRFRLPPPSSERERFIRFLVTGGLAAAANIGSGMTFSAVMPYSVGIIFAYLVGMGVAFILSRFFVFEAAGADASRQFLRFALVNVIALAQVWLVSMALAMLLFPRLHFDWHAETVAHVFGVLSPVVTSYFGHKHFSFRGTT